MTTFTDSEKEISPVYTTYLYKPNDNLLMAKNKRAMQCIKSIADKLPKISLQMIHDDSEYPRLNVEALDSFGVDYHLGREVFVIGGHAFFRRYNNDWCGTVIYGKRIDYTNIALGCCHPNVSWQTDVGVEFLEKLDKQIITDQKITFEDIQQLIQECQKLRFLS